MGRIIFFVAVLLLCLFLYSGSWFLHSCDSTTCSQLYEALPRKRIYLSPLSSWFSSKENPHINNTHTSNRTSSSQTSLPHINSSHPYSLHLEPVFMTNIGIY